MSEFAKSPVGVMQRVMAEEFRSIPSELLTPDTRVDHLFAAFNLRGSDLVSHGRPMLRLATHALDDMQYICAGAMRFAEEELPYSSQEDRKKLVKISVPGLMFPAHLPENNWLMLRARYSTKAPQSHNRVHLSPEMLFVHKDTESDIQTISFSSAALTDMDSYIDVRGTSGCPARGAILRNSVALFIDAVFDPVHVQKPTSYSQNYPTTQPLNVQ